MNSIKLAYSELPGVAGEADFMLPDDYDGEPPPVLLIHGGGWCAMDKRDVVGISDFLAENGFPVLNANYRLCVDAPWPACAEDCQAAARYLLDMDCAHGRKIVVAGGSAGGHLSLFTGLSLPPENVAAIIAISPIAAPEPDFRLSNERYDCLFGRKTTMDDLMDINPARLLSPSSPPIFISHSWRDNVVPIESTRIFAEKAKVMGCCIQVHEYEGIGDGHLIWRPGVNPHRLVPDLEAAILDFLHAVI